jgi:hypothetical protein
MSEQGVNYEAIIEAFLNAKGMTPGAQLEPDPAAAGPRRAEVEAEPEASL